MFFVLCLKKNCLPTQRVFGCVMVSLFKGTHTFVGLSFLLPDTKWVPSKKHTQIKWPNGYRNGARVHSSKHVDSVQAMCMARAGAHSGPTEHEHAEIALGSPESEFPQGARRAWKGHKRGLIDGCSLETAHRWKMEESCHAFL